MALLNAGLGALEHDGSPINPATFISTNPAHFDANFADRALRLTPTRAFLHFTGFNVPATPASLWFKCNLYTPTSFNGSSLFIRLQATNGERLYITTTGSTIQVAHQTSGTGVVTSSSINSLFIRGTRQELVLQMTAGGFGRVYLDGTEVFATAGTFSSDITFQGTSGTATGVWLFDNSDNGFYISEPIVADEDLRGRRVRDIELLATATNLGGVSGGPANPDELREPGQPGSNLNLTNFAVRTYTHNPVGVGGGALQGIWFSAALFDSTTSPMSAEYRNGMGAGRRVASIPPWRNQSNPNDGEALGFFSDTNPITNLPWAEADLGGSAELGVYQSDSTPTTARVYSFAPVMIYGPQPVDPADGALATQSVAYTVFQDDAVIIDLLAPKATQAVAYTVSLVQEPPAFSQVVSYIVGTVGEAPEFSQAVAYTVYEDTDFLNSTLAVRASQSVAYTVFGPPDGALATHVVSYIVGREGAVPSASQAVAYTVLGAGDPAAVIQTVAYTVFAPAPATPSNPIITIGKYIY
ncbi:MAG: hypothetical protein AAF608_04990 [Pseudomonadota bacterium]